MKIGFIGLGNMAGAMIAGIIDNGFCQSGDIIGSSRTEVSRKKAEKAYGIHVVQDNVEAAQNADIIFLSVKPQMYEAVLAEIRNVVTKEKILISIAPGKSLAWLSERLGAERKIVRCMPNTPALVGEGCTGVCTGEQVKEHELSIVLKLLQCFGKADVISEGMMDAVVAVSGSAPAYIFMLIEAMGDAAVKEGMPRKMAYEFAAQAVLGSAKMVLETGKHPGELKDMVCSPGGTTIEAVSVLEKNGFRSSVMEAMFTCAAKSRNM